MLLLRNFVTVLHWNLARWKVETINLLENLTSITFEYAVFCFHVNIKTSLLLIILSEYGLCRTSFSTVARALCALHGRWFYTYFTLSTKILRQLCLVGSILILEHLPYYERIV